MWQVLAFGVMGPSSLYRPACSEYLKRIQRYTSCELIELKASRGPEVAVALRQEAQRINPYLKTSRTTIVLDERGTSFNTVQFAQWLTGRSELLFILGSAWGLAPQIKQQAQFQLALTAFTLPHELARVVLLEQMYRALTLQAGHPYHHT